MYVTLYGLVHRITLPGYAYVGNIKIDTQMSKSGHRFVHIGI